MSKESESSYPDQTVHRGEFLWPELMTGRFMEQVRKELDKEADNMADRASPIPYKTGGYFPTPEPTDSVGYKHLFDFVLAMIYRGADTPFSLGVSVPGKPNVTATWVATQPNENWVSGRIDITVQGHNHNSGDSAQMIVMITSEHPHRKYMENIKIRSSTRVKDYDDAYTLLFGSTMNPSLDLSDETVEEE